jgi:hypothetical protein
MQSLRVQQNLRSKRFPYGLKRDSRRRIILAEAKLVERRRAWQTK